MSFDRDRIGSDYYEDRAPNYPLVSRPTAVSIGVAAGLIAFTLGLMWFARGTELARTTIWLYRDAPLAPYAGILVFGVALTGGRYVGLRAAVAERYALALFASMVVAVAYAAFGAGVLLLYAPSIHGAAILATAGLTTAVSLGAATLVYTTDHSFANWDAYSGVLMFLGVVVLFGTSATGDPLFTWLAFGLILLGWIVDLVFEIYMVSDDARSPVANGIGVYVAFMGVFIHLLQLVLELMAEAE